MDRSSALVASLAFIALVTASACASTSGPPSNASDANDAADATLDATSAQDAAGCGTGAACERGEVCLHVSPGCDPVPPPRCVVDTGADAIAILRCTCDGRWIVTSQANGSPEPIGTSCPAMDF